MIYMYSYTDTYALCEHKFGDIWDQITKMIPQSDRPFLLFAVRALVYFVHPFLGNDPRPWHSGSLHDEVTPLKP